MSRLVIEERRNQITKEYTIAVCDQSEAYGLRLADELGKKLTDAYSVCTFTSMSQVTRFWEEHELFILFVSESAFLEDVEIKDVDRVVILSEENLYGHQYKTVDRYMPKEELILKMLFFVTEQEDYRPLAQKRNKRWKILGFYSPVKRSLQTTFALTLGRILAEKQRVLYMSFENFPTISGVHTQQMQQMQNDLTDILYYFDCDREKLIKKLPLLIKRLDKLDYLPPADAFFDTYDRTGDKWIELFQFLEDHTDYEYLLLDLTEGIQGLLQILQYCNRIYTMEKDDPLARGKLLQYEHWMQQHAYADIIEKTMKFSFPQFEDVPTDWALLTHSELAAYARAVIQEDINGS